MKFGMKIFGASAVVLGFGALAASAATLTINVWETTTDNPVVDTAPVVFVDDAANAGALTFNISTPFANGELSGIFVDFSGDVSFAISDLTYLTAGVAITGFESPSDGNIGNGVNLGGNFTPSTTPSGNFDAGFGFNDGDSGGAGRQIVVPFEFTLSDLGGTLGLDDLERVGLRFQSVGTFGVDGLADESEKLIGSPGGGAGGGGPTTPVPLPAGLPLILSGLGVFGFLRLRSRKSA